MKQILVCLILSITIISCTGETITTDYFTKESFKSVKRIVIAPFHVRTHLPYARLNYEDQLEFHFLERKYEVVGPRELEGEYVQYKLNWGEPLKERDIVKLNKNKDVDLFVQGSIYEEDRSIFEEGNHVIVHLHFFKPDGRKISTSRYVYSGERSLVSGELIDESILSMLDELNL